MSNLIEVKVPDIGDYKDIPVIEVHIKVGDTISAEQSLITLESDKATMDVPSSVSGTVKEIKVKIGDLVSEGSLVVILDSASQDTTSPVDNINSSASPVNPTPNTVKSTIGSAIEVLVPDIGDFKNIPVIEIHVKPGDVIKAEQSLITLESDKATMDVPSSNAGIVKELRVKVGDLVSQGSMVLILQEQSSSRPGR
jgi:pyruvate dehydrogenase E2 component (dihydrolipoamide acetyltransferase)